MSGCSFKFFEGKWLKYKRLTSVNPFTAVSATQETLKEKKSIPRFILEPMCPDILDGNTRW